MCLNCGCGMIDDTMGNEENIILNDLAKAAIASEESGKETLDNMKASLNQITPEQLDERISKIKGEHK